MFAAYLFSKQYIMGAIYGELRVGGHVFPILRCTYGVHQATDRRGRVVEGVRFEPPNLMMDVPRGDFLMAWAAAADKRLPADIVLFDAAGGQAVETLSFVTGAYCVHHREEFWAGDASSGAYVLFLTLSDPDGYRLYAGGPASSFVAPAARDHGVPPVAAALLGAAVGGAANRPRTLVSPADVPPHLPAPIPNPSPDHAQVHVSKAEWAAIIKGRWERNDASKKKKFTFLQQHCSTEFHVAGDPFTYRVDDKGKVVAVYDAATQQTFNVTGTRKGLRRIPLTLGGEPTYAGTEHMMLVGPGQKNVVQIRMAGNRPKDFQLANEEAGLADLVKSQGLKPHQAPLGYTWHHRDDFAANPNPPPHGTCTMELVEAKAHNKTFVHYGACDQLNGHVGQKLYV